MERIQSVDCFKLLTADTDADRLNAAISFGERASRWFPVGLQVLIAEKPNVAIFLVGSVHAALVGAFAPGDPGEQLELYGQRIVLECLNQGKPVVWFDNGGLPDEVAFAQSWGNTRGVPLIGSGGDHKIATWSEAFCSLLYLLASVDSGQVAIQGNGIYVSPVQARDNCCEPFLAHRDAHTRYASDTSPHDPILQEISRLGFPRT